MKKIQALLYVLILSLSTNVVEAQYYSVNIDPKTVAAMTAAYAAEETAEIFHNEHINDILKHYNAAEVASAGIFSSKYLDRKAMTELGIWSSSTENYYYRRIYSLVSSRIMPKIWTVSKMMLHNPQNAIYWGPYIMKVCNDTKSLCMQFESIVTNSRLSFSDIAFLEVSSQVADIMNTSELSDTDFRTIFENLSNISDNFTIDNLKEDLGNLYSKGVGLASAGISNTSSQILQSSLFSELFEGKLGSVITIADNYSELFNSTQNNLGGTLLEMIGGQEGFSNLFDLSDYRLTSWINDYAYEGLGQFYTQRWYIKNNSTNNELFYSYSPPSSNSAILKGSHWLRLETLDNYYQPTGTEIEMIRANSEHLSGWSQSRIDEMNRMNDGYSYSINYRLMSFDMTNLNDIQGKAYAYEISVYRKLVEPEVFYEDVFDSYSMDLETFMAQMEARLSELNENEEGIKYVLESDQKNYYQTANARKLRGIETVTISIVCTDEATLGEGIKQYKCDECGSSLTSHTKTCSMLTSVISSPTDFTELEARANELNIETERIKTIIQSLETDNAGLIKQISESSIEDAVILRQRYNANQEKINNLESELHEYQYELREINAAIEDAKDGESIPTDDYERIPSIMQQLQNAYSLSWTDEGHWSGYTFIRTASIPDIRGVITFSASLSIARKPKHFMGIKIHRAIVQIDWKLSTSYSDSQVVDVVTLDSGMSEEDKESLVNSHISDVAKNFPSCVISTEYADSEAPSEEETEDTYHLLWSSDRLEIAREVDTRLTKIYTDLISLEKMMSYKRDIIDVLKDIAPDVNDDEGRRLTLIEECHKRWMRLAAKSLHSEHYDGRFEDEEY